MFEIRDPIHRTISFSEREKQIIDHPYVQRLRHVRQLGLAYTVYPSATHDRFTHALGAMHVAGRLWEGMLETSGDVLRKHFSETDLQYFRQILRLAGLLHDLGHPPFSHVSERFMGAFDDLDLPREWLTQPSQDRQATHEDYSIVLVAALPLPREEAQDISSLIHHGIKPSPSWRQKFGEDHGNRGIHRLLRSLISGELDCDRMDYLLRDAHFTGVAYGAYDIEHLLGNVGVIETEDGLVRSIDSSAVRAFEDFLLARYHMFLQVYLHKTVIAFDYVLERAIEDREYRLTVPTDAAGYADLRDGAIFEGLYAAAKDEKNAWSRRLLNRIPPKMIIKSDNAKPEENKLMHDVVAAFVEAKVPYFEITSHQYLSKTSPLKATAMMVRRKMFGDHRYEPIEKYSPLLTKYNEQIDMTHLYVLREDFESAKSVLTTF